MSNEIMTNEIIHRDCLSVLTNMLPSSIPFVYTDPPFNTGKTQQRAGVQYQDSFDDYLAFLKPRLVELYRILASDGSLFLHLDWHEVHYVRVLLDKIFGRNCFMNEIIWAYDYGGRSKKKWSAKHDTILWYAKDPKNYIFNFEEMDRIPYMAPGLAGKEKVARGKTPTDVWWHTIVPTNGKEKTGYPTQKPIGVIRRLVRVHSRPNDVLLDCFAGSGTLGQCAIEEGRQYILIDNNLQAIRIMNHRLQQ